ncbi:hypothetical protein BSKO_05345 [Bryopsis sp. KO-2023]|nr:hypothetical protein BSKO_05345 [Bryopsis sp. KO-2023]
MVRLVIHPLSLTFNVQEVETKYARHRTQSSHLLSDRSLVVITVPLLLTCVAFECVGQTDSLSLATGVVSLLTYALQWLLMNSNGPYGWERRREAYVLVLRILRLLIAVVGVLNWKGDFVGEDGSLFKNLAMRSGVLCNVWFAWGMPLLFKRHVWVQIWSLGMLLAVPGRAVCQEAFLSTKGRKLLVTRWKEVDDFFQVFTRGTPSSVAPEIFTGCFQLAALIHIVVGLLLPSFVLWHCELQSRREYVQTIGAREGAQQYSLDETWVPDPARTIVLLGMSVATLWMAMSQLST